MSDTKISNLGDATALDGTEYVPVVQSGTTKKTQFSALLALIASQRPKNVQHVTLVAGTPFTPDMNVDVYYLTTSGSGGSTPDIIELPYFSGSVGGFADPLNAGHVTLFVIEHQTTSSDYVHIQQSGSTWFDIFDVSAISSYVDLFYSGAGIAFVNNFDQWATWLQLTDFQFNNVYSDTYHARRRIMPGNNAGGHGTDMQIAAGSSTSNASGTGAKDGGSVYLTGGNSSHGNGGNIVLHPGQNGSSSTYGYVIVDYLPTSNPGVAGALWNNAGVLSIS